MSGNCHLRQLAQRWIALREAIEAAIEPTINELLEHVRNLKTLLETGRSLQD